MEKYVGIVTLENNHKVAVRTSADSKAEAFAKISQCFVGKFAQPVAIEVASLRNGEFYEDIE